MPPSDDSAQVRVFPPAIYLAALAAAFLLQWALPLSPTLAWRSSLRAAGWVLIALGLAFIATAVTRFRAVGTTPNPTRPTTALVFRGPYRVTRNPMYLGLTLITAGIGLAASTFWPIIAALLAAAVTQRTVIVREERYLEQKFGAAYLEYTRRVRRWL
jgi:protein-S-isoprenylcysteine O-methyltransferase Ste14